MKMNRMLKAAKPTSGRLSAQARRNLMGLCQTLLSRGDSDKDFRTAMVIGLEGGEGASTVALYLAHALSAETLGPICLVRLLEDGQADAATEFTSPVGLEVDVSEATIKHYDLLIAPGEGLRASLLNLSEYASYFVIDGPPLLTSTTSCGVCREIDSLVLVAEAERTTPSDVDAARAAIERCGGRLIGAVLNKRRRHLPRFVARALGGS